MSWALGDQGTGYLRPFIPDNSVSQLTGAYELLTGKPLPELRGNGGSRIRFELEATRAYPMLAQVLIDAEVMGQIGP